MLRRWRCIEGIIRKASQGDGYISTNPHKHWARKPLVPVAESLNQKELDTNMQIAICDDNENFLLEAANQLSSLPMVDDVSVFSDLASFLRSAKSGKACDAVLMDIDFNDDSTGMDAAAELYKLCPQTKVIYVTGNIEYSQQVFLQRANLSGFLTKPINPQLLQANLQKVIDDTSIEEPALVLKQSGTVIHIPFRDIIFIESKGHTVETHTHKEIIVSYQRLNNITPLLPRGFYQCHKSYIVNMGQIQRFKPGEILLKSGQIVPVSRSKYNETKEAYFSFIGQSF